MGQIQKEETSTPLWIPANAESTHIFLFKQRVEDKYKVLLPNYGALYQWSIKNIGLFWQEVWDYTGIVASRNPHLVSCILSLQSSACSLTVAGAG